MSASKRQNKDSRMRLLSCWRRLAPASLCLAAAFPHCSSAQGNAVLSVAPLERVKAKRGETFTEKLRAEMRPGFHVNSNTPSDEYLIPIRLTWTKAAADTEQVIYPKPQLESFPFSEKPVS